MKLFNLKERKGFTLVELMIVVAIIGILAALAIPAFLRYIKQSKTAEAEANMKKLAEGSKAYFTSEQRYVPASGDQPWHVGASAPGATNRFGMPVPWDSYVMPGAATSLCSHVLTGTCATTDAPQGGAKKVPVNHTNAAIAAALNKMRVSFEDPTYFVYNYVPAGTGNAATATITALADFDPTDTSLVHTVNQSVTIDSVSQEPVISPSYTVNEFE